MMRPPERIVTLLGLMLIAGSTSLPAQGDSVSRSDTISAVLPRHAGPLLGVSRTGFDPAVQDTVRRPRAIEYSNAYNTRLTIHKWGSYVELPLFVAEYFVGQKVLSDERGTDTRSSLKGTHSAIATGLEALFAINTVTGLWNLYDSRHDPAGRTRRWIHSIAMLAADAGFVYTAGIAGDAKRTDAGANNHRSAAIVSMGVATASTVMMWLWKN